MLLTALALSMSLSIGIQKAQAVDADSWNSLRNAIVNGTDPTINITEDINRRLVDSNQMGNISNAITEITINGKGHSLEGFILSTSGDTNPIITAAGQILNIKNLNQSYFTQFLLNNGTANITGSSFNNNYTQAIHNNGILHITDSTFSNNSGETNQDASVYNNGGTVYINGSKFSSNTSYNGAAIANAGGTVVIENSTFDGNHTTGGNGGAIDTWSGTTTIIDSSFTNNHANDNFSLEDYANSVSGSTTYAGGAINNNDGGTLNIVAQNKDVEFTNNYVGSIQEGQWPWDPDVDNRQPLGITNNGTINLNAAAGHSIIFNDAIGYALGSNRDTNIININKSDVSLTNSAGQSITTPTAGTIAINNAVYDQTVNLYRGTLKFGTSGGFDSTEGHHVNFNIYGGLLDTINGAAGYTGVGRVHGYSDVNFALDADADLHFADHYDAYGNYVAEDGVSLNISKISIINSLDNKFVGEAVDVDNGNSTWEWVNVKDDTELVDADGNKIEGNTLVSWNKETGILKAGKYNLNNAVSDNETVSISDGGNYNRENVAVDLNSDRIYRLVKDEIVSQTLGDMTNGSLTIAGNKHNITANGTNIGGIVIGAGDTVTIKDVLSFNGFSSANGGALNISGGTTNVSNTNFENNSASQNGGAINITGGTFNMTGGSMSGNEAQNGGAIYAGGQNASVELNNTIITENIAGEGSAIYNNGSNITLTDTNITENTGASSIYNTGTINILTSEAGKSLTIDNKQSVIKNGNIINLNAASDSNIVIKDDIVGLSAKTDENVVNVNNNTGAAGTVYIGKVSNSTVNVDNGTANINGDVITSNINARGKQTNISGNVLNSSNVTTTAGATSITGNVTGSKVDVSGGTLTTAEGTGISAHSIIDVSDGKADIKSSVNLSTITVSNTGDADISGAVTSSTIETTGGTANFTNTVSASDVNVSGGETTIASLTDGSVFEQTNGTATINSMTTDSAATQHGGVLNLGSTVKDSAILNDGGTTNLGIAGENVDFTGSTLTLTSNGGAGSSSGTANLTASALNGGKVTINFGSALNTENASTIASTISGAGNINKTGNTTLSFSNASGASGADFTGLISASGGTVELNSNYGLNADANINLSNAILNYTTSGGTISNNSIANINLNGSGIANIDGSGDITLGYKFWTMNNTGNTLNFNDAKYIFADGFTTGGDTVRFDNADISLDGKDYTGSNITLNDSSLQLSNHSAGDEYKFGNLISENDSAEITLDVNLAYDTNIQDSAPVADTIEYADGSSGLLNITELFITDDNGALGQAGEEGKIIQVLKGNGSLQLKPSDGLEILSWATNVYEYGVDSAETEHTADSIKIAVDRPSSTDTLRDLNRYNLNNNGEDVNHNRGFSFITGVDGEGNPIANEYHIYRDLDTTAAGTFTILGRVENGVKSVLSGKLEDLTISEDSGRYNELSRPSSGETYYQYKDADGNVEVDNISADNVSKENGNITFEVGAMGNDSGEDARGSMFELVNATELSISDVSVEDALRTGTETSGIHDGAVIYADNEDATVELENTDFKNNSVKGGNGGAIANMQSETFSITNALFEGNSASANGGAIYNADDMTIGAAPSEIVSNTETMISAGNTSFAGNTAVQGGAIYNAQNAEMTISSASSVKEINGQPIIIASTIEFTGNAAEQGGAIYNAGILNMKTSGDGKIIVDAATNTASNDIYNVWTLNLNGDITINSAIKDAETASGTTNLNGGTLTLGENATVTQKDFNIASGVAFTTNADKLSIANLITNAGTLTFTGGANANNIKNENILVFDGATGNSRTISGEGSTTINKGTVNNTGTITQGSLLIASDATLKTNASSLTIANAIENSGSLTFTGGENKNAVENAGTLTFLGGLNSGTITNNNSLIFNGEITNNGGVSGAGTTTVAGGNVINKALISQAVEITGGKLTSTAENLGGTITNNSELLLSGTLDKTISGTGTTSINSKLSFVDGANIIKGTLNMNNGTLDLNEGKGAKGKITEHNIGKLTGTGTIKIDANLSRDAEEADSDTLNVGSAENASINIYSINVTADHVVPTGSTDDPYDSKFVQVIDGAGKDNVNLTLGGNNGKVSTLTSDYLYEFVKHETNNGAVKVNMNKTTADLADFIQGDGTENIYTYSMTRDETTPPEIGTTNRTDATNIPEGGLNLYLNGHTLSSGQASDDGITVADGYTLNVTGDNGTVTGFDTAFENNGTLNVSDTQFENNQNALTNNAGGNLNVTGSTFADNDTAITNNAGANLNLSDIVFNENGVDVDNNGTLNLAGNTVIEGGITGQGTTNITSGVTNAVNTIVQDKLNISSGATLDGAGNVTANVNNEGTMNYADGSVNANTITGNGILNAQGNLTNGGNVSQGTVNIASGSTFTNSGTLEVTNTLNNTDSTIANSGELTLAGQNMQNNGTINGSGTTNISGKLQNNGSVEQDVEITQSGELTSSADNIKNNILNNGVYNITGGTIANAITGSGDLNLSSNMALASSITGNNINLNNGILSFAQSADISGATLNANGGSINLQNDTIQNTNLGNLILNSDLNLMLDGSFADKELDTITANSFTNNGGHSINISNILLSTPTKDMAFSISPLGSGMNDTVSTALAGAIQYTGGEIVYSPIYKYSAKYDPETALLNFNRVGGGGYDSYNPGVFAGAVAAQLGGYLTQLNSYDEAFRNMDMYMLMTQEQRQAMKMRNKYAAASADSNIVFDPTITQYENKAGWFRPYATFEKVDLKGGPTVSNVAYGSFFGAESEMYDLGHGWDGIWGVYGGYNGSHQAYDGVGIYQNGGTLGAIGMAYKGNFFTGLTANVGANSGEASTMYGQDNFTLLMSGVASKSGYNWELAKGKFIIQPNFLISYSYVNTFNYRDAQGVGIESDPLHAIQIEPGIKLIGNLKNGWQPYASVSMVWNIMDKTQFQANYVSLPELSVKPFVKYGVGVRKSWGERFTGFFQTYFTNGGRNGVGLQLGLRFMLGKSPKKTLNGPVPELKKTVIKVGRK